MAALSWNEIKDRALKFSKEWADTQNEEADAKPFLIEFFNVFGVSRKRVATFEERVMKLDEHDGYIDLFWKGTLVIEMKSRGKNLDKAFTQAKDYLHGIKQHELPKYILVSDFDIIRLHDLEEAKVIEFKLKDFVSNIQHFGFIAGYQKRTYKEQDPVNIKAAELMGKLHDRLKEIGYEGHHLEIYLVRILFLLFAEDTTIFEKQQFQEFIEQRTSEDGSDLAAKLQELFQVLNTPIEKRFKNLDEAMPSDLDRMGIKDGIWVCSYEEFKGLCAVLRESIIQLSLVASAQENKGDKMHMLYDFLTSNTFRMQVEAIVEGFSSMKEALESEKRAMQRIWKEREKQIEKVITNTIEMYGSIKGIAGNAIQSVKALELPGEAEDKTEG